MVRALIALEDVHFGKFMALRVGVLGHHDSVVDGGHIGKHWVRNWQRGRRRRLGRLDWGLRLGLGLQRLALAEFALALLGVENSADALLLARLVVHGVRCTSRSHT